MHFLRPLLRQGVGSGIKKNPDPVKSSYWIRTCLYFFSQNNRNRMILIPNFYISVPLELVFLDEDLNFSPLFNWSGSDFFSSSKFGSGSEARTAIKSLIRFRSSPISGSSVSFIPSLWPLHRGNRVDRDPDPHPIWIQLRFGSSFDLDPVPVWILIRFGSCSGLDPDRVWILIRFGSWSDLDPVPVGILIWFGSCPGLDLRDPLPVWILGLDPEPVWILIRSGVRFQLLIWWGSDPGLNLIRIWIRLSPDPAQVLWFCL